MMIFLRLVLAFVCTACGVFVLILQVLKLKVFFLIIGIVVLVVEKRLSKK
jgi:hypothetical protein